MTEYKKVPKPKTDYKKQGREEKVYWCTCVGESRELARSIRKGSIPKDTGKICNECGGKIFEEDKK